MKCLKCGKETQHEHVFCDHCLDSMAAYPVKPGAPIHLPKPAVSTAAQKPSARKKAPSLEEQVGKLKKTRLWLSITSAVLLLALALSFGALVRTGQVISALKNTGKNYSVATTPED